MIPKIVHYCWFGDKPMGELEQKCVASWSKLLPDYEIKRWGNECLDQFDNKYLRQAVEAKKWAFVSDYVRLVALWNEGGIYFDTDEEVVKSLDEFLDHDFVIGSQRCGSAKGISPALIGTVPHHEIIGHILDIYNKLEFVKPDGSYDQTPNPVFFARVMKDFYGINDTYIKKGKVKIKDNCWLYPYTYFCTDNKNAYAIHHYSGSWRPAWRLRDKWKFRFLGKQYLIRKYKYKIKHGIGEPMPQSDNEKILFSVPTGLHSWFRLIEIK